MSVEELIKIVEDESLPLDERVDAAAKLWRVELTERPLEEYRPIRMFPYSTKKEDVYKAVENVEYIPGTLDEVLYKGLFKFYKNLADRAVSRASTSELLDYAVSSDPFVRSIARERLMREAKEEVEKASIVEEAISKRELAEAIRKQAESMLKNIPRSTRIFSKKFLSEAQVESIKKPTRWYAKQAFKSGIWKESWGDPSNYGIDVERTIYYIDSPQTLDFVKVLVWKGVWKDDWGTPEEWLEKLR